MGRIELELKGVVPDPDRVRAALLAAGARPGFRGMLHDRRYDRAGELTARDEVLRVRTYMAVGGDPHAEIGWKGPTRRSPEGYKQREEREILVSDGMPAPFLEALGFTPAHAIDRYVEIFEFEGAHARLEWYPRMDVLIEVEGDAEGIEQVIHASGLPRASFTDEALTSFTARYDVANPGAPNLVSQEGWAGPRR